MPILHTGNTGSVLDPPPPPAAPSGGNPRHTSKANTNNNNLRNLEYFTAGFDRTNRSGSNEISGICVPSVVAKTHPVPPQGDDVPSSMALIVPFTSGSSSNKPDVIAFSSNRDSNSINSVKGDQSQSQGLSSNPTEENASNNPGSSSSSNPSDLYKPLKSFGNYTSTIAGNNRYPKMKSPFMHYSRKGNGKTVSSNDSSEDYLVVPQITNVTPSNGTLLKLGRKPPSSKSVEDAILEEETEPNPICVSTNCNRDSQSSDDLNTLDTSSFIFPSPPPPLVHLSSSTSNNNHHNPPPPQLPITEPIYFSINDKKNSSVSASCSSSSGRSSTISSSSSSGSSICSNNSIKGNCSADVSPDGSDMDSGLEPVYLPTQTPSQTQTCTNGIKNYDANYGKQLHQHQHQQHCSTTSATKHNGSSLVSTNGQQIPVPQDGVPLTYYNGRNNDHAVAATVKTNGNTGNGVVINGSNGVSGDRTGIYGNTIAITCINAHDRRKKVKVVSQELTSTFKPVETSM